MGFPPEATYYLTMTDLDASSPQDQSLTSGERLPFLDGRQQLLNEAHARPAIALNLPCSVSRVTLITPPNRDGVDQAFDYLTKMCADTSSPVPHKDTKHHILESGSLTVMWERHTEFCSLTFIHNSLDDTNFQQTALDSVPQRWLDKLPGKILSATHVAIVPVEIGDDTDAIARKTFGRDDFAASKTEAAPLSMMSDFRAQGDSFVRILLFDRGASAAFRGRTVQRLLEVDTYRLAALMALPIARNLSTDLNRIEAELERLLTSLAEPADMSTDRMLLADLSKVAGEIEELNQQSSYRLSASRAYYSIVLERIQHLREGRITGRQRIGSFIDRRLGPAMRTCEAIDQRQQKLAERASRAAQLLRTRVNVAVEEQNARLLESLNQRSEMQLRLQETVEGLSVVALTYYAVGLLSYLLAGVSDIGVHIPKGLILSLSVPAIAGIGIVGVKRMREQFRDKGD